MATLYTRRLDTSRVSAYAAAHRRDGQRGLIAIGALGVADNIVVHWILRLHRAVPGEHALAVEIALVAGSLALLAIGLMGERRARRQRD